MEFRRDINGLRAAAVLAVIVFHFNSSWLPGGFSGVDIFFVISGYLMTGIIFKGIDSENFSILKFYLSRARRIIPALAVLCLALSIFGYLFLVPKDFEALGKHAASSLLFISNIIYLGESGYFDTASHEKWLLHTWSLSVEWQFYIIYPIILVLAARLFGSRATRKIIPIATLIGFLACIIISTYDQSSAFYLLPARAWEMLAGGSAFLYPVKANPRTSRALEVFGWSLVVVSLAFLKESYVWPGYLALAPVLGAYCIIQANHKNPIFTNSKAAQTIGLYSYSMYLWHWPIIVLSTYFSLDKNIAIMLAVLIIMSALSYNIVERKKISVSTGALSFGIISAVTASIYLTSGYISRVSPEFQLNEQQYHSYYYGGHGFAVNRVTSLGATKPNFDAMIAGDSFALQYARKLDAAGKESNIRFTALFHHGCIFLPTYTRYANGKEDESCGSEYKKLMDELSKNKTAPLILAGSWNGYNNNSGFRGDGKPTTFTDQDEFNSVLTADLQRLINEGGLDRQYYIVGSPQKTEAYAFRCLAQTELLGARALKTCQVDEKIKHNSTNESLKVLAQEIDNVHYVDPNDVLCKESKCLLISNRQPIHSDRTHLSIEGARIVGDLILHTISLTKEKYAYE